jgi:serine protease inhibitor ecotin
VSERIERIGRAKKRELTKNVIAEHFTANALSPDVPYLKSHVGLARQIEALQHEVQSDRLSRHHIHMSVTGAGACNQAWVLFNKYHP